MDNSDTLSAELREAERALESTLNEACASNVSRADTGELIRIDEMLAIASDAAKKAISIRRRRHLDRPDAVDASATPPVRRQFTDADGAMWAAWAVLPHGRHRLAAVRLSGDLQHGWITFESGIRKRRLSPIPAGWEHFDEPGLRALLRQAQDAPPPRRSDDIGG